MSSLPCQSKAAEISFHSLNTDVLLQIARFLLGECDLSQSLDDSDVFKVLRVFNFVLLQLRVFNIVLRVFTVHCASDCLGPGLFFDDHGRVRCLSSFAHK